MSDDRVSSFEHHRAHALLPWWVNGTLDADDHRVVERHLAECTACQQESALLRRVDQSIRQEPVPAGDVEAALGRVLERIDHDSRNEHTTSPDAGVPVRARHLAWLSVAAVALLAFGTVTMFRQAPDAPTGDGDYTVLASPVASTNALQLEVRFSDQRSADGGVAQLQSEFEQPEAITGWERVAALTYRFALADSVSPASVSHVLERLSRSEAVIEASLAVR